MPKRVDWSSRADHDLAHAFPRAEDRRAIKELAEAELEYPPNPARTDEGYVAFRHPLAFRRALPRGAPTLQDDLQGDLERVDPEGPGYGEYLYVYRPWVKADAGGLPLRHGTPEIYITRFLGNEELAGSISSAP